MFFFNFVEHKVRLSTDKQEFLTLLHLRSFRQFQNLSEEKWSRAAENLIELCFVDFLSNKSKKCFILVWILFPSSEIIAMSILNCVVWTIWQQTLKSQWTETWCEILWNWSTVFSSDIPNLIGLTLGVGYLEKFYIFNLVANACDSKLELRQPCCREVTHCAPKILDE